MIDTIMKSNESVLLMNDENGFLRRSWAEINLTQLRCNYEIYKSCIPKESKIMAVVKADAYGHGDIRIASALQEIGVCDFAVSNIEEACSLRMAGICGQILILGYTPIDKAELLLKYDVTQALLSKSYAEMMIQNGLPIKCQYAIDTGMNRIGLDAENTEKCSKSIRAAADKLKLTGLFSHLCVADSENSDAIDFTNKQIRLFEQVVKSVEDLDLPYVHVLNSAGGLWHATDCNSLVRLGIVLYGLKPDYANQLPIGIKPILTWKSVVSMVKEVHAGETIGYGRTYNATQTMKIATIPTGYADGYNRKLSNKGYVLIHGCKAQIVGRVCMDQFMIDVSKVDDVQMGDEVILLGQDGINEISADDMAEQIGTIGYEVVCCIGKRVPRIYRLD